MKGKGKDARAEGMAAVRRQERQDARVRADAEAMDRPSVKEDEEADPDET